MARMVRVLALVLVAVIAGVALAFAYARLTGLSARASPGNLETAVARAVRGWAVPADVRQRANPAARTEENVRKGRDHYARYCATCHANDGSGEGTIGRNLFPPAPDMRLAATQDMTDGELFHIIEEGVRFTGMPAWGDGSPQGEELAWQLVHFIRRLPQLTTDEIKQMEAMNPRPPG